MAFVFLFPIVQTFCFLYAIGGDIRNIKLAVVNEETMYKECNITDFNHTAVPYSFSSCNFTDMSCRALKSLDNHMVEMVSPFSQLTSTSAIKKMVNECIKTTFS